MANSLKVTVPDIGGFKDVSVIDVLVKDGQRIDKETPMITIETEKAAMDVPSPAAGRIVQVKLKKGDKVSEGSLILLLESGDEAPASAAPAGCGDSLFDPRDVFTNVRGHFYRQIQAGRGHPHIFRTGQIETVPFYHSPHPV